ncbi:hypothetical protein APUTEX25_002151, partial [Auxenochlorella protothecoides]
ERAAAAEALRAEESARAGEEVAAARNDLAGALLDLAELRAAATPATNSDPATRPAAAELATLRARLERAETALEGERHAAQALQRRLAAAEGATGDSEALRSRVAELEAALLAGGGGEEAGALRALHVSSAKTIDSLLVENESLARRVNGAGAARADGLRPRGGGGEDEAFSFWAWIAGADLVDAGAED